MSSPDDAHSDDREKMDRRGFLKLAFLGGVAAAAVSSASILRFFEFVPQAGTSPSNPGGTAQTSWPRIKVGNVNSLKPLTPVRFNYPLVNTPNLLIKLGTTAQNGVGPAGDIVAFSTICQHLGYYLGFVPPSGAPPCNSSYSASKPIGYCCAHGGQYDFTNSAQVVGGPPPRPIPGVKLEVDQTSGDIFAVGMNGPSIFGHGTPGTTDPALVLQYDLQGGEVVTDATVFS